MKQIEINGILWDTENLEIGEKKYFTWQEAIAAAKSVGKRLPTKEEYEDLIASGYEFDEEKQGMWFADRKLFFPLYGSLDCVIRNIQFTTCGLYWSSSLLDEFRSWVLSFNSSNVSIHRCYLKNGLPLRCIQDKSDNLIIEKELSTPSKDIDWEQRRYEIAKDLFCNNFILGIEDAIIFADKFIKKLKVYETI